MKKITDKNPTYICMFVSRNKDNQQVMDFKPRKVKFLTHANALDDKIQTKFSDFVQQGQLNESSRMYFSVNARNVEKTQVALQHYLLDYSVDLVNFENKLVSIAAKPEHALTHHWLLDIDTNEEIILRKIEADLKDNHPEVNFDTYPTVNGYAIVCEHGFDTRKLLAKFTEIDLKRDDMLLKATLTKS